LPLDFEETSCRNIGKKKPLESSIPPYFVFDLTEIYELCEFEGA